MLTYTYDEVLSRIQNLTLADQLRLLEDLAAIIRRQAMIEPRHSILEFEGVGQEAWKGIDVQEFIDQERNSWDG
jgi:hypothetical protein